MNSLLRTVLLCSLVAAAAAAVSHAAADPDADGLYLLNGDRLTGRLIQVSGGVVTFATEYAGRLEIRQEHVKGVSMGGAVEVMLEGGALLTGRLVVQDEAQRILLEDGPRAVPVTEIAAVTALDLDPELAPEPPAPPKKWSGAVGAGASLRTGSTSTLDAHTTVKFVRRWPDNVLTFNLSGQYGEVESQVNTRQAAAEAKWQHYLSERFYFYTLAGAEQDKGRKLDLRLRGAGGLGYDFIDTPTRKLSGDLGVSYVWDRWNQYDLVGERRARDAARDAVRSRLESFILDVSRNPVQSVDAFLAKTSQLITTLDTLRFVNETTTVDTWSLRAAAHYEQALFARSKLVEHLAVEPSVEDIGEFRALSDLSLTTPLWENLNLRVNLKSEYESEVRGTRKDRFDNTLMTILEYTF